jgi:Mg2+ and Co2+ transporter CorA
MEYKDFNDIDMEFNEFIFSNKKHMFHKLLHSNLYKLKIITLKEKSESVYIQKIIGYNKDKLFYNIEVPDLYTELIVIQKNEKNKLTLYTSSIEKNINFKKLFINYLDDIAILIRILKELEKYINVIEFYLLDDFYKTLDKINFHLIEYEESYYDISIYLKQENDDVYKNLILLRNRVNSMYDTATRKATYLDMKTSRSLTIVTLITFPILITCSWFGTNFPNNQMVFMNSKHSYIIFIILTFIFLILIINFFRKDIFH